MDQKTERVFDVRVITAGGSAGRVEFQLSNGRVASVSASIEASAGEFARDEPFRGPRGDIDPDPVGSVSVDGVVTHPAADAPNAEGGSAAAVEASEAARADSEKAGESPASETAEPAPLKGKLPEDFPGHAALDAAGIHTYGQLRKALADGVKIPGVGDATTAKIEEALAASSEE